MAPSGRERMGFLLRSLYMQGSWSYRQMQGLGFFFAMEPWLRRLGERGYQEACRRHLKFFNTHPYMASYVLGVVARREEDGDPEGAIRAKESLMGPLGAAGDGLFWGGVRPLALVLSLCLSLFWPWVGVLFMLVAYNTVHLWARWTLFDRGYGASEDILSPIEDLKAGPRSHRARAFALPALGFLVGVVSVRTGSPGTALLFFAISFFMYRRGLGTLQVALPLLVLALLLGWLGLRMEYPWSL